MANNLVLAEASRMVDASLGTAGYTAISAPMKLRLMSTTGTNASAGTEVVGGSYASATIAFGAASSGSASNSGTVTFTGMPAITTTGVEIWDSAPRRNWTGALTVSKATGAGDSLSFPPASITASIQ